MATLKQRLHRKNESGTYDTIHLETSADLIVGTLGIAHGGTGAVDATTARTNLGAAASSHTHPASQVTAGTLPSGVVATNGTDYSTSRIRNIRAGTGAAPTLANGEIYLQYE